MIKKPRYFKGQDVYCVWKKVGWLKKWASVKSGIMKCSEVNYLLCIAIYSKYKNSLILKSLANMIVFASLQNFTSS